MERTQKQKQEWKEFLEDNLVSMDSEYKELRRKLDPVFHNKTKYVNGKLMKECFKHFGNIIQSHYILRRDTGNINKASLGGDNE